MADIITLDNIGEKVPQWTPHDDNHNYAIVDMGSNGIRFSITSLAPPSTRLLIPRYSTRAAISLFDALTPSDHGLLFPQATIESVSLTLARFTRLALLHDVPKAHIMVLATEAMRRAANASDMLKTIAAATDGIRVHVLHPSVETLVGAVMGSRSGLTSVNGGALFLDLGGGSVQMTWVDTSKDSYELDAAVAGKSLPYGAAKLTRILDAHDVAVRDREIATLRQGLVDAYHGLCSRFPALNAIDQAYRKGDGTMVDMYTCGGGFRGYGSLLMHDDPISPYPIPYISSYTVDGARFKDVAKLRHINATYTGKIYGLSSRRRAQFPAIATVIEAIAEAVPNIRQVTFCSGSNREGTLMMKLPVSIRESHPFEALAALQEPERPVFDAVLAKLRTALPPDLNLVKVPTVLVPGLSSLFIREMWQRHGHDTDTNTSYALHHAVSRDCDSPGLTHLGRALLALTIAAKWGGSLGPSDVQLQTGLRQLLQWRHPDAAFWAKYIGAVSRAVTRILPILPSSASEVQESMRFDLSVTTKAEKKDKIHLVISVTNDYAAGLDIEQLIDTFEKTVKKVADKKSPIKASLEFKVLH